MKRKPVLILGCGPSGLLAAHACRYFSVPFSIMSKKQKSVLGGAQFSHIPIPGLTKEDPDASVKYVLRGDIEEYRRKVYGETPVPFVSMENVQSGQLVPAWNLRRLYDGLWADFEAAITDWSIGPEDAEEISNAGMFSAVFSAVPQDKLCLGILGRAEGLGHWFRSQPIRIHNAALWEGIPDNTIVYDGSKDHSYYRMSKLFGVGSTEWGASGPVPPGVDLKTVYKPVQTNCDCHPRIIRIGRFATWTKGQLTLHAFGRVLDLFAEWGLL